MVSETEPGAPAAQDAKAPAPGRWRFWIDRGGTFTDIVARTPTGSLVSHKLLSVAPERYQDAALAGIRALMGLPEEAPLPAEAIETVRMGTTVATNALLERAGAPTALLITAGLRDVLEIGFQNRPELFSLAIKRPALLYQHIIEVPERLDANGEVLAPLDEPALRTALADLKSKGSFALAVVLMHAYRNPAHERQVEALARAAGFTQISLSHQVSPLMKIVPRGQTTVIDATLSPVLRTYVDLVARGLALPADRAGPSNGPDLYFMKSDGGLTRASHFRGRDAILSGPAGGVVGMAETSLRAGADKAIGFDMGGTSTDVSHFAGTYERDEESLIDGLTLQVPMMAIHTVAAGGGSRLWFREGRLQVGPESAGADPGPACYRRGGPLTVTDANLLLGKLLPDYFPHVFGPDGDQPLAREPVQQAFAQLTEGVNASKPATPFTPESLAEAYLTIAVENMAQAIKKISVAKGYDVTGYMLNCFGGAGAQHACLVAETLQMERILIHPFAGVLSAVGMGLASLRAQAAEQIDRPLKELSGEALTQHFAMLRETVNADLRSQGADLSRLEETALVHLKYLGTNTALAVPLGTETEMGEAFEAAHQSLFGFSNPGRALTIERLSFEAAERLETDLDAVPTGNKTGAPTDPTLLTQIYCQGAWREAPVFDRFGLAQGQVLAGPALLTEPASTIVIEPGWEAVTRENGDLLLTRQAEPSSAAAVGALAGVQQERALTKDDQADPLLLEVFNNLFMSIAEQMGTALQKTASSVNIKERLDFSCAVFDAQGHLVANAPHVPVHLGSMGDSVRAVMKKHQGAMQPGDVFVLNAPYLGGTHLPDITVIAPVFLMERAGPGAPAFYVAARGHHADVGGITPGSMSPQSTSILEEGVMFEGERIVRDGVLDEAFLRRHFTSGAHPARNVEENIADLKAQIAACRRGAQELLSTVKGFGAERVQAYMGHVQANAEEAVRQAILTLKDGEATVKADHGFQIKVALRIDRTTRSAVVDFTGTSPQQANNFNAPAAIARAAVLYVFRCLVTRDIPLNEGCLAPLALILPKGSVINPQYPAAVVAGNVETSQMIADALLAACGAQAGSQGTMNNLTFGDASHQYYETLCGGTGAGPGFDGADAVHSHMTNSRLTDPEVLETRFPVRLARFEKRKNSGGSGQFRGGEGVIRELQFSKPLTVSILSNHRLVPPQGLAGGATGEPGHNLRGRRDGTLDRLPPNAQIDIAAGETLRLETPGGGGYGPASQRSEKRARPPLESEDDTE